MICRNPQCYAQLGILHTDNISEKAYFVEGVSRKRRKPSSIICPKCGREHDLRQYVNVGETVDGTDEIPSESRVKLEDMSDKLRQGITRFPKV